MYFYIILRDKKHDNNKGVKSLISVYKFNLVANVQEITHHVIHPKYPLFKTVLAVITR
jgi:hypothetical protein